MANATPETPQQKIVAEACRQFPNHANQTLGKKLHREHPFLFKTLNQASCAVRWYRGNRGPESAKSAARNSTARKNGAATLPPLPVSQEEEWIPFEIDARRSLLLSDIHLPFQNQKALKAALKHGDTFDPDAILFNGDVFDFYQLSRFDKNPNGPKVANELGAGKKLFTHVRQRFPRARLFFKLGNHDERWAKYVFDMVPLISDVPGILDGWETAAGITDNGVTVIGDQRPIMFGKLPVLHGHELGKGISSPVNPARGAWLRAHHTIIVGHSHQSSNHTDTNMWHAETQCWSTGCLCGLTPSYARVNKWNHGFATVEVYRDGSFDVQNMRIASGKVRKS